MTASFRGVFGPGVVVKNGARVCPGTAGVKPTPVRVPTLANAV
jgi:hypothetical protein